MAERKMIILIDGRSDGLNAKTGLNLLRYSPDECVAVFDRAPGGPTAQSRYELGGDIPVIDDMAKAPKQADTLVLGVAPPGGKLPERWREIILEAIEAGLTILSGLHDFLCNDRQFADAAARTGAKLVDVRRNSFRQVSSRKGINESCLRIHTVGHDCNVGKMLVSVELAIALNKSGVDTKFVPTGQTGIMIEGDGIPIDCVVSDFVNGAAEQLVRDNQHHDVIIVEGQGCVVHPRYSAVTLGLLHGCMPDGLILCYEMGRENIYGMEMKIPPLATFIKLNELLANTQHPCKVIGVAMNSSKFSEQEAQAERQRLQGELALPVADVIRHGCGDLTQAIVDLKKNIGK